MLLMWNVYNNWGRMLILYLLHTIRTLMLVTSGRFSRVTCKFYFICSVPWTENAVARNWSRFQWSLRALTKVSSCDHQKVFTAVSTTKAMLGEQRQVYQSRNHKCQKILRIFSFSVQAWRISSPSISDTPLYWVWLLLEILLSWELAMEDGKWWQCVSLRLA